jgi:UDP-N-acetylmuramoyl-tripeptide--D-alanyl-D-alanine ligase
MSQRHDVFSWDELAAITGGAWLLPPAADRAGVTAVFDDTRAILPGSLFVAIRGESVDGHGYLDRAVTAGAGALCVERLSDATPDALAAWRAGRVAVLQVPNSLTALQELARAHRGRFPDLPVVALTGSCGKTSTKEMLAAVLAARWPGAVLKTEGNTNNHFGVPRNLLRLGPEHRAAVIECGSNHPGEIALLTRLTMPTIGVVSNIGRAHLEFFGDLAGVAREKGSIYDGVPATGAIVYPAEAAHVEILQAKAGARRTWRFGTAVADDVWVRYEGAADGGAFAFALGCPKQGWERRVTWGLGGAHQAANAAAAACVGLELGLSPELIAAGLANTRLPGMRMEVTEAAGVHWVNDAYNSNPDSARASLAWFAEITAGHPAAQCIAVLGDMREMGAASPAEHVDILRHALTLRPGWQLMPVGAQMTAAAAALGLNAWPDAAAAQAALAPRLRPGLWILLKGSRGIRLESLLPTGLATTGAPPAPETINT